MGRWGNKADIIRYLLLLNHPENSDFSWIITFKTEDYDVGLFFILIYLFTIHKFVHPSLRIYTKLRQVILQK